MNIIQRLLATFRPQPAAAPDFALARALGMPEQHIVELWQDAQQYSTPDFEATRIFDNLVAIWEYAHEGDVETTDTSK